MITLSQVTRLQRRWLFPVIVLSSWFVTSALLASSAIIVAQDDNAGKTAAEINDAKRNKSADPDSEFATSENAWEFDPYKVKVWICHDQSSYVNSNIKKIISELESECVLVDRSGWRVSIEEAPLPWNWRILQSMDLDGQKLHLVDLPEVEPYDKLICARVRSELGRLHYDVQELDIKTQQWGAKNIRVVGNRATLVQSLTSAITQAFMPLAKIDKVVDKKVKLRVRASGLVQQVEFDENGENGQLKPNLRSPVSVTEKDVFLPVIRRLDRDGKLEGINRVDWTYLSIVAFEETLIECTTHATGRAPLAGRVGRRTQRFALVIRAPNRPTVLKLTSKDKDAPRPLPGLEIYSRTPEATSDEASEKLGETDWRGTIVIPPNDDSMRVLYVKSGMRPLARLPIIPGLFERMTSTMPDDEKRLYAEGIVTGLNYELLDLVAQRTVIGQMVESYLSKDEFADAQELITKLRGIDDSTQFNTKLNNELKRLQSSDPKEAEKISTMFDELQRHSDEKLSSSLTTLLGARLDAAKKGEEWQRVTLDGSVPEDELGHIKEEDVDLISEEDDISTDSPTPK